MALGLRGGCRKSMVEWSMKMTEPAGSTEGGTGPARASRDLFRALVEATGRGLGRCSAGLGSDGGANLFSGVFVRYRDRHFVVTAAHCLAEVRDWGSLRLVSEKVRLAQRPPRLRKARGCRDDAVYDIAFLELDAGFAASLDVDWIEEGQMHSQGLKPGLPVLLRGSPVERAIVVSQRPLGVSRRDVVFVTRLIDPPTSGITPPAADVDLFLEFDPGRARDPLTGEPVAPPSPRGMSGSGAFVLREPRPDEIWDPRRHIRLVGIQSAALTERARCLRAKRIELGLAMLENYRDGR